MDNEHIAMLISWWINRLCEWCRDVGLWILFGIVLAAMAALVIGDLYVRRHDEDDDPRSEK